MHVMDINLFRQKFLDKTSYEIEPQQESVINRYYKGIELAERLAGAQGKISHLVNPILNLKLPRLNDEYRAFFNEARMDIYRLPDYADYNIHLLDLTLNQFTQTTKIYASLLTVAKIVEYIRQTGESVIILTPSSANKGIALTYAVSKAIAQGLVPKEKLKIVTVIPESSSLKLRTETNPKRYSQENFSQAVIFEGNPPEQVKHITAELYNTCADEFWKKYRTRLWYSLHIDNYRLADTLRAFFDYEMSLIHNRINNFKNTWHIQSVSSAYGLIGYHLGCMVLAQQKIISEVDFPGFFLVQPLNTPDMVLHLLFGNCDRRNLPIYHMDGNTKYYVQNQSPYFPYYTHDPDEILESTFYSHLPATKDLMSGLIGKLGGSGIVVSLAECMERFALIHYMFIHINLEFPTDPRIIKEWSSIMALTGALNAIDRKLIPSKKSLLIHSSGLYTEYDLKTPPPDKLPKITQANAKQKLNEIVEKLVEDI
jgi:Family of unknown function (DUF6002)